jgi:hypothetical protein
MRGGNDIVAASEAFAVGTKKVTGGRFRVEEAREGGRSAV